MKCKICWKAFDEYVQLFQEMCAQWNGVNQQFCKTFNPLNNIFIHFERWDDETAKVDIHQKSNIYDNLDTDDYETKHFDDDNDNIDDDDD